MADGLCRTLGQSFVIENRTGAGTLIGPQIAARAAPDGYTLLVGGLSNIVFDASLYKDPKYDPLADFSPIGPVVISSYVLITRKDVPVGSYQELSAYALAHPEKLTIASGGPAPARNWWRTLT